MFRKIALLFLTLLTVAGWTTLAPSEAAARYASIVVDADTGQVLHAVNADTRNYPASLTKMMTLYMVFQALENGTLKLDQRLKVSKRASGMPPSKLGLKRGQTITVEDAILALTTKSANDVAVVVAEALAGKETTFAKKMTETARKIGMSRTTFRNASGLPNRGQKSTARDMVRLAKALMENYPQYYHYFSTRSFTYNGRTYRNHNKLLKNYKGTDGIKTGYTRASGFNLVSSVERNGRRVIAVVFGGKTSRSRDRHMVKLLDRGFTKMASMGVKTIPEVPGRNPFQNPAPPVVVAAAKKQDEKPELTRKQPVKPVAASSQIATTDATDMPAEAGEMLTNDWTVQVGAFSRFRSAHSSAKAAMAAAPKVLRGAKVAIERIDSASTGTLYRSQLTGLYEQQARNACQELMAAEMNCVVIQPMAQGSN
ncbi:D-alanyl-D-alanine carboxypeptidase family protein [Pelagibius marinus]|uniref:D-alanyl-D-alanine carboxypeptidase family protein n=1 Tax=Pelagibius marinus TaxID=2762760 RepID=UPI001872EC87|nr:D-alanyl-D-alanine carboxypeptidase family protein [Pelagibius marinus]